MAVTVPETDLARIKQYCETVVPEDHLDQARVHMKRRGRSVTILDCRPLWATAPTSEWTDQPIAQLRYDAEHEGWSLYWADRNSRWHPYDFVDPHQPVAVLLEEIEKDPTCIFWG